MSVILSMVHFADALPKLKGLAIYPEENDRVHRGIEVVAEIESEFRVIDLSEPSARAAVMSAATVKDVYQSEAAHDYVV